MQKIKPIFHILFWLFVFFYTLDVLIYFSSKMNAVILSVLEVAGFATIFYTNLFILIPKLLISKGKVYYLSALFFISVFIALIAFIFDVGKYYEEDNYRMAIAYLLNYLLYIVISFLYWYLLLYQQERQKSLLLQNEKLKAELLFLKSQVSPHFLFNSLNNIYSLSVIKNDNAPVMIEKLSDILRYIIYEGKNQFVPLEREIELLNNFIDLQLLKKLKAEKNISVSFNGVSSLHKIVPLLLINIIENCFKHSDIGYNANGFLRINLKVNVSEMRFIAENSFLKSNKEPGIGLINLEKQLQHYYPDKHELIIEEMTGVYKVDMTIDLAI